MFGPIKRCIFSCVTDPEPSPSAPSGGQPHALLPQAPQPQRTRTRSETSIAASLRRKVPSLQLAENTLAADGAAVSGTDTRQAPASTVSTPVDNVLIVPRRPQLTPLNTGTALQFDGAAAMAPGTGIFSPAHPVSAVSALTKYVFHITGADQLSHPVHGDTGVSGAQSPSSPLRSPLRNPHHTVMYTPISGFHFSSPVEEEDGSTTGNDAVQLDWETQKPEGFTGEWSALTFNLADLVRVRGHGKFSEVYQVPVSGEPSITHCAVKKFIPKFTIVGQNEATACADILRALTSFNNHIVRYYGALLKTTIVAGPAEPDSNRSRPSEVESVAEFMIMSEWVEGTNLEKLISEGFSVLTLEERLAIGKVVAKHLLIALRELNKARYAHNDIKPDNVLLDIATKTFKLADFSNAAEFNTVVPLGNPLYSPPERIGLLPDPNIQPVKRLVRPRPLQASEIEQLEEIGAQENSNPTQFSQFQHPVGSKTDIFGVAQIVHRIVFQTHFTPQRRTGGPLNGREDAAGIQFSTMFAWMSMQRDDARRIREIFPEDAQTDQVKRDAHVYAFINRSMHPDVGMRAEPEEMLNAPYITENYPGADTIEALLTRSLDAMSADEASMTDDDETISTIVEEVSDTEEEIEETEEETENETDENAANLR